MSPASSVLPLPYFPVQLLLIVVRSRPSGGLSLPVSPWELSWPVMGGGSWGSWWIREIWVNLDLGKEKSVFIGTHLKEAVCAAQGVDTTLRDTLGWWETLLPAARAGLCWLKDVHISRFENDSLRASGKIGLSVGKDRASREAEGISEQTEVQRGNVRKSRKVWCVID